MGMPLWEVSDGDADVARRGGRGLSIPALLAHYSGEKAPAIKKCCGRIFHTTKCSEKPIKQLFRWYSKWDFVYMGQEWGVW